mmetsp:Transcript_26445/g.57690  ORF Transcript_26445/g.57690 Transcript_26445/m.57690 type:complete len:255 (+) Transcript_26445:345-1109(+)
MSVQVSCSLPVNHQMPSEAHTAVTPTAIGGPQPMQARQGRHKQRYGEGGERLVAGCIPVRHNGSGAGADAVEVLLVSSRGGKGYCFPKGGWETDETVEAAAKRETVEEAGVRGVLEEPMVGIFPFQSLKGPQSSDVTPHQGKCIAHMYVMHVAEELDVWPESKERQRHWCPLAEASIKCRYQWMREALHAWIKRKGWHHLLDAPPVCTSPPPQLSSRASDFSDTSDSIDMGSRSQYASMISVAASEPHPFAPGQ